MEILQAGLDKLLKPFNGLNTTLVVTYSGSTLTSPPKVNFDAPISQHEVITFVVSCKALGVSGKQGLYQLVDQVRKQVLGVRVTQFDPLISAFTEVAAQYKGEVEPGFYSQDLVIQASRPITIIQKKYA